jgi:hypothetical protein
VDLFTYSHSEQPSTTFVWCRDRCIVIRFELRHALRAELEEKHSSQPKRIILFTHAELCLFV